MIGLIWFLILLALLALAQGRYYGRHAMDHLHYSRRLSAATVNAGDAVTLEEEVFNDKLMPLPWLRAEYRLSASLRMDRDPATDATGADECLRLSIFQPGSYSRIIRRHTVLCTRRGVYELGSVSLSAGDLLSMAVQHQSVRTPLRLTVYPRPIAENALPREALQWQGDVLCRRWIFPDPILVGGLRSYLPGDSRRDVHWKATARSGQLQVKVHEHTARPRVLVVLNITPEKTFWGSYSEVQLERLEYGVSLAATAAVWAWRQGLEIGFCTNAAGCESFLPPVRTAGQLEHILRALALLESRETAHFARSLEEMACRDLSRTDILILSPWWDDRLERSARKLRRRGNSVTWLNLRKEEIAHENKTAAS